ncbi:MAG: ABC transporter ATP-binding protein [Bryobacteraceae bacterium]|jgi:ABC-type polysaccharide/polyol phosphate transport system ATPase subunit
MKLKEKETTGPAQREDVPREAETPSVVLQNVGVRYRLLTEDHRTIKGRLFGLLSPTATLATEFWALRNVNLTIRRGDVVGVIGANGSGKSTLARVLAKVISPVEGSCTVRGRVTPLLELGGAFNTELTGRENTFLLGAVYQKTRAEMSELMPNILSFSELGPFLDVPVKTYSSGMVARLAFAVCAQLQPEILVLDEVLSVGDEHFQKKSLMRMRKLIERGSIVVIVSHGLDTLAQFCNRIIWLSHGEVVADGKPADIVARYRRSSL